MDEKSKEVLQTYARLNLPHLVARTLSNARPFLLVSIVGEQGVGKSTYAYYAVKVGLMAYLCKPHGINLFDEPERCAERLERIYGELCLSRECGKDQLDEMYGASIYTGPRGLSELFATARFIATYTKRCVVGERPDVEYCAMLAKDGERRKVLFLDDLLVRTAYHMGVKYRRAYAALRELLRLARVVGKVVVLTAPAKEYLPPEVPKEGEFIVAKYGFDERRFVRMHSAAFEDGGGYLRKRLVVKYVDAVPAKAAFGMPKWLEEEITKRKLQAIEDISRIGEAALYDYVGGIALNEEERFYLERLG
jgi:hypothetical protein